MNEWMNGNCGQSRLLVVGAGGQLGGAIARRPGAIGLTFKQLDVTDAESVSACLRELRPRTVVNAAAYTAVDAAESEPDLALRVNRDAVAILAKACGTEGIQFVHISTDFVFDGSRPSPIPPSEPSRPLSVYGHSKLAGENVCRDILGEDMLIVRTAWVYASGHANFVATMLRLMRSQEEIGVVADQVGTPTWVETLASGVLDLITARARGTHHLTDSGVASWYDFAVAIEEIGRSHGLLGRSCRVRPIRAEDYPTPAIRPSYGVLDKSSAFDLIGGPTPHWRESLYRCLAKWEDPA